jgi:hypothetical protein
MDSTWVSDFSGGNLSPIVPTHPIFNTPNPVTGPILVTNWPGSSYASRDVVNMLRDKPGIRKLAGWVGTTNYADTAGILAYYYNNQNTRPQNLFFTFAISQFTDQQVAKNLIENAAELLMSAEPIPVEMTSFTASANNNSVNLSWKTASETNNMGFEVERSSGMNFEKIGFVPGKGTTTNISTYNFTDDNLSEGIYSYRLKQMDFNGTTSYTQEVLVEVTAPVVFDLAQNYPNPFNPSTSIKFSVPADGMVTLAVYNLLGEKVVTLLDQEMKAGRHQVNFDAARLSSGLYFYRLDAGDYSSVKKMMLLK